MVLFPGWLAAEELETVVWKGRSLWIKRDPATQAPLIIRSLRGPLWTVKSGFPANRKQAAASGPELVAFLEPLIPVKPGQLQFKSAEKIAGSWYISFWQTEKNLIVYGSSLGYSIEAGGRIQSVGAVLYPDITVPEKLLVSRNQALKKAISRIKGFQRLKYRLVAENMLIFPDRAARPLRYYQVYAFNFFPPEEARHPGAAEAGLGFFVDTQTGKIVDRQTLFKPLGCCVPEQGPPLDVEELYKSQIGK